MRDLNLGTDSQPTTPIQHPSDSQVGAVAPPAQQGVPQLSDDVQRRRIDEYLSGHVASVLNSKTRDDPVESVSNGTEELASAAAADSNRHPSVALLTPGSQPVLPTPTTIPASQQPPIQPPTQQQQQPASTNPTSRWGWAGSATAAVCATPTATARARDTAAHSATAATATTTTATSAPDGCCNSSRHTNTPFQRRHSSTPCSNNNNPNNNNSSSIKYVQLVSPQQQAQQQQTTTVHALHATERAGLLPCRCSSSSSHRRC